MIEKLLFSTANARAKANRVAVEAIASRNQASQGLRFAGGEPDAGPLGTLDKDSSFITFPVVRSLPILFGRRQNLAAILHRKAVEQGRDAK